MFSFAFGSFQILFCLERFDLDEGGDLLIDENPANVIEIVPQSPSETHEEG